MTPEVEKLFHEVADLPPAERLARLSDEPAALRAEVQALLDFDSPADHLLTDHVAASAQKTMDLPAVTRCGPYILLSLLGRGGMGAVYLADRADGELKQRVAIKLLRFGGAEPSFRDRFLRERQILASLSHPGIARVLDAGHTTDGQPYLVMEYIEGQPIDVYAATLDIPRRLQLFIRVCEAVAYAHRNLVIHRDLKPSNIIVNGAGEPKLLDFGIARILDDASLDETRTQERVLTPQYASPEQMQGSHQATTSDIFSLGSVLYKLLTGTTPAAPDAIPPSRLNPDVSRDLDAIVGKARRREPEERYVSVDSFADDIQALLESRPVRARSGNAWYRTRKFLRRYWAPIGAVALVVASLAAGLLIANRERVIAQRRFDQLRQLSRKLVNFDVAVRNLPGSTEARERLVSAALEYLRGLAADARGDIDLDGEIADTYFSVAQVQGVPTVSNLGHFADAELSLRQADVFNEAVLAARPHDMKALVLAGAIEHDRMIVADTEHRREDSLAHARKSSLDLQRLLREPAATDADRDKVSGTYANIALAYLNLHLYDDAVRAARLCVEIGRPVPGSTMRVAGGLSVLASALRLQGDLSGALTAIREARTLSEAAPAPTPILAMINRYGIVLREGMILGENDGVSLDRPEDAIPVFQKAFDMTEEAAAKTTNDFTSRSRVATSARYLGDLLRRRDPRRALAVYDTGVQRLGEVPNSSKARRDTALLLASSSYALRALHRNADAQRRLDEAIATLRETHDYPAARIGLDTDVYLVECALADQRPTVDGYRQLLEKVLASHPDVQNDLQDATRLSHLYERLAAAHRQAGAADQAASIDARRLELWRAWDRKIPNNEFITRQLH